MVAFSPKYIEFKARKAMFTRSLKAAFVSNRRRVPRESPGLVIGVEATCGKGKTSRERLSSPAGG